MKGVLYSITAILLFSLLLAFSLVQLPSFKVQERENIDSMEIAHLRLTADAAADELEDALEDGLRRGISLATAKGVDNAETALLEMAINGTLNGSHEEFLDNHSLANWAAERNRTIALSYEVLSASLRETDSFTLEINATIFVNFSSSFVYSARNLTTSREVSIEGFEDPLFNFSRPIVKTPFAYGAWLAAGSGSGQTNGTAATVDASGAAAVQDKSTKILVTDDANAIDPAILSEFLGVISEQPANLSVSAYLTGVSNARSAIPTGTRIFLDSESTSVWDQTKLDEVAATAVAGYYRSGNGPSFLDRLEKKTQLTRTFGLESLVDAAVVPPYNSTASAVDYLYLVGTAGRPVGGFSTLRLDTGHGGTYGVTSGNYTLLR